MNTPDSIGLIEVGTINIDSETGAAKIEASLNELANQAEAIAQEYIARPRPLFLVTKDKILNLDKVLTISRKDNNILILFENDRSSYIETSDIDTTWAAIQQQFLSV